MWSYVSWYFFFFANSFIFIVFIYIFIHYEFVSICPWSVCRYLLFMNFYKFVLSEYAFKIFINCRASILLELAHDKCSWVCSYFVFVGLYKYWFRSLFLIVFFHIYFSEIGKFCSCLSKWLFISWHILNIYEFACFPLWYCINFLYMSLCPHLRKVIFFILTWKSWSMDTPA